MLCFGLVSFNRSNYIVCQHLLCFLNSSWCNLRWCKAQVKRLLIQIFLQQIVNNNSLPPIKCRRAMALCHSIILAPSLQEDLKTAANSHWTLNQIQTPLGQYIKFSMMATQPTKHSYSRCILPVQGCILIRTPSTSWVCILVALHLWQILNLLMPIQILNSNNKKSDQTEHQEMHHLNLLWQCSKVLTKISSISLWAIRIQAAVKR